MQNVYLKAQSSSAGQEFPSFHKVLHRSYFKPAQSSPIFCTLLIETPLTYICYICPPLPLAVPLVCPMRRRVLHFAPNSSVSRDNRKGKNCVELKEWKKGGKKLYTKINKRVKEKRKTKVKKTGNRESKQQKEWKSGRKMQESTC
jgi:hypothetical protein